VLQFAAAPKVRERAGIVATPKPIAERETRLTVAAFALRLDGLDVDLRSWGIPS
jgi:hypothetical protein